MPVWGVVIAMAGILQEPPDLLSGLYVFNGVFLPIPPYSCMLSLGKRACVMGRGG